RVALEHVLAEAHGADVVRGVVVRRLERVGKAVKGDQVARLRLALRAYSRAPRCVRTAAASAWLRSRGSAGRRRRSTGRLRGGRVRGRRVGREEVGASLD